MAADGRSEAVIEVANVGNSVVQVAVTALRNVIGQHSLDEVLKEQAAVSEALQNMIDVVTEPWGVKVKRVQMKDVEIPETMQRAMSQEAEALREKRARQGVLIFVHVNVAARESPVELDRVDAGNPEHRRRAELFEEADDGLTTRWHYRTSRCRIANESGV